MMENTIGNSVCDSDESSASKQSSASRGRRRSARNNVAPTRRSSRISTQQQAAEIERSIYADSEDSMFAESEPVTKPKGKGKGNGKGKASDDGYQAETILGATSVGGQLQFMFKWKGRDEHTLVPSEEAKHKYTYHVLDFYESCMVWESDDETDIKQTMN